MTNRVDIQDEERLFLIAPVGYAGSGADPVQPANFWRWRRRFVHRAAESNDNVGWSLPPLFEPDEHAAALAAHARRIRSGFTTSTVLMEDL